jgi:ABC-type microcin C transport system duplicated ATPase subunit YejF
MSGEWMRGMDAFQGAEAKLSARRHLKYYFNFIRTQRVFERPFQDPFTSLNPRMKVGQIARELLAAVPEIPTLGQV